MTGEYRLYYSGFPRDGNGRTDSRDGTGGEMDQASVRLDKSTREALICRRVVERPMQHERLRGRYGA